MARSNRLKSENDAYYHVMSRISGQRFLLEDRELKREMIDLLMRTAAFSGVSIKAYCIMDDHFHIVCKVVKPDQQPDEAEVLRRIRFLKPEEFVDSLRTHWASLRKGGEDQLLETELNRWRRRMHDLSQFGKTYKELVNIAYKRRHQGYVGGLWAGRFNSTLVESGSYLRWVIRYVELNPIRAKMVTRIKDYAFCSHGSVASAPKGSVPGSANAAQGQDAGSVSCSMAGTDPGIGSDDEWLMRKVAQIGSGKVFGSMEFVSRTIGAFRDCFGGRTPEARKVQNDCYSSHGHRLAKTLAA